MWSSSSGSASRARGQGVARHPSWSSHRGVLPGRGATASASEEASAPACDVRRESRPRHQLGERRRPDRSRTSSWKISSSRLLRDRSACLRLRRCRVRSSAHRVTAPLWGVVVVTAPDRPVQYWLAGSSSRGRTGQWSARMRRTAEVGGRDDGERMPLAAGPGVTRGGVEEVRWVRFCTFGLVSSAGGVGDEGRSDRFAGAGPAVRRLREPVVTGGETRSRSPPPGCTHRADASQRRALRQPGHAADDPRYRRHGPRPGRHPSVFRWCPRPLA